VTPLGQAAEDYLALRRSLGHKLADAGRLLPRFVAFLDQAGARTVTIEAAVAWAQEPDADPGSTVWARRLTVARGFARHMSGIDPRTEIPAAGLISCPQRRRPPFIFSDADVTAVIAQARTLRWPLPALTHETLIGLLAVTGLFSRGRHPKRRSDPHVCPAQRLVVTTLPGATRVVQVCQRRSNRTTR
jgi:hypothetical protein